MRYMQGEAREQRGSAARTACVLLALVAITTCLAVSLHARFSSEGEAEDSARVAKFSITASGELIQPIEADFVPGSSKTVDLQIQNNSEVAMEYTVTATNETGNLPLKLSMAKDPVDATSASSTQTSTKSVSFEGQQEANHGESDKYKLTIGWPVGSGVVVAQPRDPDYMGKVDYIAVRVIATQID